MADQNGIITQEDKAKQWKSEARFTDLSNDPAGISSGYQDLVGLSFKLKDNIADAITFAEDKNYGLALMGKNEFIEKYGSRFEKPDEVYKTFESAYNTYNAFRKKMPVEASVETVRFDGTKADTDKFTRIATEQQTASSNNYFIDKKGMYKPMKYKSDYNDLKLINDSDGIPVWKESQDDELIKSNEILSFVGPKKMESTFMGSLLRGAWSGAVPTIAKGVAGVTLLAGGIADKFDDDKEAFADKDYYKRYVAMTNWANYMTHTNEDEDLGFLNDINSATQMIANGATQMIGIFATSGGAALGLKAIGKLGVKMTDGAIMSIATNAAMFAGSAEAVGPISEEMLAAGFTPSEAALPLFIAGGITYASERVLGMNISQKFGAALVLNKYMGQAGKKDINGMIREVVGRELKKKGVKSAAELDAAGKKALKAKIVETFSKARSAKMSKLLEDINFKKVALSSLEEGAEEYIEGFGDMGLFKYLNNANYAKADSFLTEDKFINWELQPDGTYNATDSRTNETHNVTRSYKEQYNQFKEKTVGILSGGIGLSEGVNIDEGLAAAASTFLTLGIGAGTGLINHSNIKMRAKDMAIYLSKNPDKMDQYKANMSKVIDETAELDAELARQVDQDVQKYLLLIEKYQINSPTVQAAMNSDKSLARNLLQQYENLDELIALQEKSKEEGFNWSTQEGIKSPEQLAKAIEIANKRINEYKEVKPQELIDKDGKIFKGQYSNAFTDLYNSDALYEYSKNIAADTRAVNVAKNASKEVIEGEIESEYSRVYSQAKKEALQEYDMAHIVPDANTSKEELLKIQKALKSINSVSAITINNYKVTPVEQRKDVFSNIYSETIATRYMESIDFAVNQLFNDNINEDYNITGLKAFNEAFQAFSIAAKGKTFEEAQTLLKDHFKVSSLDALLKNMGNHFKGLSNVAKSSMQDPLLVSEIGKLQANARAIYDLVPEDISDPSGMSGRTELYPLLNDIIDKETGKAPLIEGLTPKTYEDLTDEEKGRVKQEALMASFEHTILDGQTVGDFLATAKGILDDGKEIPESQIANLKVNLNLVKTLLEQYRAYVESQGFFENEDYDQKLKEHSAFSKERMLELGNDPTLRSIRIIDNNNNLLNELEYKLNETAGNYKKRAMKIKLHHLDSKNQEIIETLNYASELIDKKRLAIADKVKEKLDDLQKQVDKLRGKNPSVSLFSDLFTLYENLDFQDQDSVTQMENLIFSAHKAFIGYYDAFENGGLDRVLEVIKEKLGNEHLTFNKAFGTGAVVDHSEAGLEGFFSGRTVKEGFDIIFSDTKKANIGETTQASVLSQYLASSFLLRMSNYGKNGSSTYRQVLKAYSQVVADRISKIDEGFEQQMHASSYEQYEVVAHVIGFLQNFAGDTKQSKESQRLIVNNLLNIRGYAGAGKTQQVLYDAIAVYSVLNKGKKLNIKYVSPTLELNATLKDSIKPLTENANGEPTNINIKRVLLKDYLREERNTDSDFDFVIIDEASVIPAERYSNSNKLQDFTQHIIDKGIPYLMVTDDSQVASKNIVSAINTYDTMMEKTIPLVEVYRTGISQFKRYQYEIRKARALGEDFKLMEMTFFDDPKTGLEGGQYFSTEQKVVDEFIKYVDDLDEKKLNQAVLIVFDEAHKQRILNAPGNANLKAYEGLIRTLVWEDNDLIVSGLKSNAVFLAINKDENYIGKVQKDYNIHYSSKLMLTGLSRAEQYLVMVGNESLSSDLKKNVARENAIDSNDGVIDIEINKTNLRLLSAQLNSLADIKSQENEDVEVSGESNLRTGNLYGDTLDASQLADIRDNFFKTYFDQKNIPEGINSISEIMFETYIDEKEKNDLNRLRKSMFKAAAVAQAKIMFNIQNGMSAEVAKEDGLKYLSPYIKLFYEKDAELKKVAVEDINYVDVGTQLLSIELPSVFFNDINSLLSPNEEIFNGDLKGRPLALRIAGWVGKGQNRKPIVDIIDVSFGATNDLSDYSKAKLLAYARILMDNGILINQIRVAVNRQLSGESGWAFVKAGEQVYTLESLAKGLKIKKSISNILGNKNNFASVPESQLLEQERTINSLDDYKRGQKVSIKGYPNDLHIVEITAQQNGQNINYRIYAREGLNSESIMVSGSINQIKQALDIINAEYGDKFKKNPEYFSKQDGKFEVTSTAYLPYYDGLGDLVVPDNVFDKSDPSKNAVALRRKVINLVSSRDYSKFNYVFHETMSFLNRDNLADPVVYSNVVTIELTKQQIKSVAKLVGLTEQQFIDQKLHILAPVNPIDIGFKKGGLSQTLFYENETDTDSKKKGIAQKILNDYNNENFDEFKEKYEKELNDIFGNAFNGDIIESELVDYNKYKLFRLAAIKKAGIIEGTYAKVSELKNKKITQDGIVFVKGEGISVEQFENNIEQDGFEMTLVEYRHKGIYLHYTNKQTKDEVIVRFHPDVASPEYINERIDEVKALESVINGILNDPNNQNKYLDIIGHLKQTKAYQFIYSNKENLHETNNGVRTTIAGIGANIVFDQYKKDRPEKLLIKGNMKRLYSNMLSALTKMQQLNNDNKVSFYKSTNDEDFNVDFENGKVKVEYIANPYINIDPQIYIDKPANSIPKKKTPKKQGRKSKKSIFNFSTEEDFAWRDGVTVELIDDIDVVIAAVNDILGSNGLDITEFTPSIVPNESVLGLLSDMRIKLLAQGNRASVRIARHEAMHYIMNHLISPESQDKVINEARNEMLRRGINVTNDNMVHEWISDMFMDGNYKTLTDERSLIRKFVDWVKQLIGIVDSKKDSLIGIMNAADNGYFRNSNILNTEDVTFEARIDTQYTSGRAIKEIEKYFGKVGYAQEIMNEHLLRPAISHYSFLNSSIADQGSNIYNALGELLQTSLDEYIIKEAGYKKNGILAPIVDEATNKIVEKRISYDDIVNGRASNVLESVIDTVTTTGEYSKKRGKFFTEYFAISVFRYDKNEKATKESKFLMNSLIQLALPSMSVETMIRDSKMNSLNKQAAITSTIIFRDPNKDSSQFNPNDTISSIYDIFLSNIPYVSVTDKNQSPRGFVNSKLLFSILSSATVNLVNNGEKNITIEGILKELQTIQAYSDRVSKNTIHSFMRVMNGTQATDEYIDRYNEYFEDENWEDFTFEFKDGKKEQHIGILKFLGEEFKHFGEPNENDDEDIKGARIDIKQKRRYLSQFLSGLKLNLLSTVKSQMGKIDVKGNNYTLKMITANESAIDRNEFNTNMASTFQTSTGKLRAKAKQYILDNKKILSGDNFLNDSKKEKSEIFVDALKNILGITLPAEAANVILEDNLFRKAVKGMFSDIISFAEGQRSKNDINIVSDYSEIIDQLIKASTYSNNLRLAEMVKTVENELAYSNTLNSYYFSMALGPTLNKGLSLSERIIKGMEEHANGRFSPLNANTNPLLSRQFKLKNIFFLNGVSVNETIGTRVDNLNSKDKFILIKSLLFDGVQKGINEFYAYSDTMSDKIRLPFMYFTLNDQELDNIFSVTNYNLSINDKNLFNVLQKFSEYDKEVIAKNKLRFKELVGSEKVSLDDKEKVKLIRKKLKENKEYVTKGKFLVPSSNTGYDIDAKSMSDIRKAHAAQLEEHADQIMKFVDETSLEKVFRDQDFTSFTFASKMEGIGTLMEDIEAENTNIDFQIAENKKNGVYQSNKVLRAKKKALVSKLMKIIYDNKFMYKTKSGEVHLMPILELNYWSHYIGNKTLHTAMRGSQTQTKDVVDYVKRAAGMIAPGNNLINPEYSAMSSKINTITLDDIEDFHKAFDTEVIEATDGISLLNPVFHEMLRRMSGGLATNVSAGSLKNVYYNYDTEQDRVNYHKYNQFAISSFEYDNSDFYKSFVQMSLGGKDAVLFNIFDKTYKETKDFDQAITETVNFMEENTEYNDSIVHYAVFKSAVKQGDVNSIKLKGGNSVSTAMFEDNLNSKDNIIKLDPVGYRMQQITVQDTFNSRTSVPSQIMNVVSVLSRNSDIANDIEKALSHFSSDIRTELLELLKSGTENEKQNKSVEDKRRKWIRQVLTDYAMKHQSVDKTVSLMTEDDIDFNIFRDKIMEILSSKVTRSLNGSMPGAYHIQGTFFGKIYVSKTDHNKILLESELTDENRSEYVGRELVPQGYDTKEIDAKYKTLFEAQELIINSTLKIDQKKIEAAKVKLEQLKKDKIEELKTVNSFIKAEVIMPFIYADKFGVDKNMTLAQSFKFGESNLYSASGNVTYEELLKSINNELEKGTLKINDIKNLMPESVGKAFVAFAEKLANANNEQIKKLTSTQQEVGDLKVQDITKMGKKDLAKRLATFYLNFNRALDVYFVRIPTTGSSMGSTGRLVAFGWGTENTAYISPKKNLLDGSDYDADQLNMFFRAIDSYGKVVDSNGYEDSAKKAQDRKLKERNPLEFHQNMIFNAIESYYNNPLNKEFILQKIDLKKMKAAAEKDEKYFYYNQASFFKTHETNSSGRKIVGHFANLSTFLNNISRAGRNTEVQNYLSTITDIFNNDNEARFVEITNVLTTLVNAATDNANLGGLLGRLNITEETSPLVAGFLFSYSKLKSESSLFFTNNDDIEDALYEFMKHPVIANIVNTIKNKNTYTVKESTTPVSVIMGLKAKDFEENGEAIVNELKHYAKIGEQLKRMGMVIQAYRNPGSSLQDLHAKIFDIEFALGMPLYKGYLEKIKSPVTKDDFDTKDQVEFVKENLKPTLNNDIDKAIRDSFNIPFIVSALGNVNSQLRTISTYNSFANQAFKVSNFEYNEKLGLDTYEENITANKGNRSVDDLQKYFRTFDNALTGNFLDTMTKVELVINGEVRTYDLSKIKAADNGRLAYVQDFLDYYDSLSKSHVYKGNSFFQAVRVKSNKFYKNLYIENLSSQNDNVKRELKTGFRLMKEVDKQAFRTYQLLLNGFYNYRGSMNSVMDDRLEKDYTEFLEKSFKKMTKGQKEKMLTNIAIDSQLGLSTSRSNYDITKAINLEGETVTSDISVKKNFKGRVLKLERIDNEKLGYPVIFAKNNKGEFEVSTMEYGGPFNIHSTVSKSAFAGKFLPALSFADIQEMNTEGSITIQGDAFNFLGVSSRQSIKTLAMPANGDIVILRDGSKARIAYNAGVKPNYTVTVTPVKEGVESRISSEALRSTAKKLDIFVSKIQEAFPNIDIQVINDPNQSIGSIRDGIVYLNDAKIQYDTPFHEVSHIFIALLKTSNNAKYQSLVNEAEILLNSQNDIAMAVAESYPDLKHEDLIDEIIATVMGLNSVEKVKGYLANANFDQSFAERLYNGIISLKNKIYKFISDVFSSLIGIDVNINPESTINSVSDELFNSIINGEEISTISSEELMRLMPNEAQSRGTEKIKTLLDNDNALSKNSISDLGNEEILISRMKNHISNNIIDGVMTLSENYIGEEVKFTGDIHSEENLNKIKNVIATQHEHTQKKMDMLINFMVQHNADSKNIDLVYGTETKNKEEVSVYDNAVVMKVVNGMKYDQQQKVMRYSELENHPKYGYLYNPDIAMNDFIIMIRDVKGQPVIQFYSYFNYHINNLDHYAEGVNMLDNFVNKREALKARLKMLNTKRTRLSLNMTLVRNYFHKQGALVANMGIIEHTKQDARFEVIDQAKYTNQVKKIGTIEGYTENLSDELKSLFKEDVNQNDYVSYYDVLMSFYDSFKNYDGNKKYVGYITDINKLGEDGIPTMIDMLKYRLSFLQSTNPSHDPSNYNLEALREVEFLTKSIYELEFLWSKDIPLNERRSMSSIRLWGGAIDLIGDENIQRINNTVRRTDAIVVKSYLEKMKIFTGTKKEDGIYKWFDKRHGNKLLSYAFDTSNNMFEDLFVKVKTKEGVDVNTRHIYWTTDVNEDPLYAELAQEKLRQDPTFIDVIKRGRLIVGHIEDMLTDNIIATKRKTELGTMVNGKLKVYSKEDAYEDLKKMNYVRGSVPIMNKKSSAYFASGNIGKALSKLWEETTNISEIYDDVPLSVLKIQEELNTIRDLFVGQLGVGDIMKDTYGNLTVLEKEGGYSYKDGKPFLLNAEKNNSMMKDLETLMNYFTMSVIRKAEYEKSVLPIINAGRTLAMDDQVNREINNKHNLEFIDMYTKQAVKTQRVKLEGDFLGLDIDKSSSFLLKASSAMVMTMNFNIGVLSATTNAAYAFIEGISTNISKGLGYQVYGPGAEHLLSSSGTFFKDYNLVSQLAHDFRVFNSEDYEMIQHRIHQQTKRSLFSSYYINWLNWATDVYARSTSMVAIMKMEGSYNAHEYDKATGTVKYNPLKDERFFKKGVLTPEGKALAGALVQRLRRQGLQDDANAITHEGFVLPTQAYDLDEQAKFKAYANRFIVGNYDNKSAALLGNVFLGRLFSMFKKFMESRINNALIHGQYVKGSGQYVVEERETKDIDGSTVYITKWESVMVEGYLRTIFRTMNEAVAARDLKYWSKLQDYEKANVVKGATNIAGFIFMSLIYSLLVSDDWDENENDHKLPPLRVLKNFKYSYQSLLAVPLLYEAVQNPFALIDISTGLFVDSFGKFKFTPPFVAQVKQFKEFGVLVSGKSPLDVQKQRAKRDREEREQKRKENESNKNNQ